MSIESFPNVFTLTAIEDFDIQGDQLFFNGDLIGYLTVPEGTLRGRVVDALLTHVSIEDREDGLDSDDNYPVDD